MQFIEQEVHLLPSREEKALANLEAWLETMRGVAGYGGAVAHWWQQSLMYTGAGLDWRYEGIIGGYLALWARTGNHRWLRKARRAGMDLVAGQLASGHFAASAFEINPATAGTPHEAACDIGLLRLALALREAGDCGWERFATCAERNLQSFYIKQLWDAEAMSFRDLPGLPSFVPNKAATACEAFFLLAELRQDDSWVEQYALPTLERLMQYQVKGGTALRGAIAQNSLGSERVEKYFPIYISRCVPALLRAYQWSNDGRYVECALGAIRFIARFLYEDGSLPTVIYANQEVNRYPSWIAPLGDVLSAAQALRPYGLAASFSLTHERLLAGQDESGGIQTATGFAAQANLRPWGRRGMGPMSSSSAQRPRLLGLTYPQGLPDVRDLLHVVGWCDKAFGYLATLVKSDLPSFDVSMNFERYCTFQGHVMHMRETSAQLEITKKGQVCYRWHKGEPWPEVATPEFWLK